MVAKERLTEMLDASEEISDLCTDGHLQFTNNNQRFCVPVYVQKPTLREVVELVLANSAKDITTGFVFESAKRGENGFFQSAGMFSNPHLSRYDFDTRVRFRKVNNVERAVRHLTENRMTYWNRNRGMFGLVEFSFGIVPEYPEFLREFEDEYRNITDYQEQLLDWFEIKQELLIGSDLIDVKIGVTRELEIIRKQEETRKNTQAAQLYQALIDRVEDAERLYVAIFNPRELDENADFGILIYALEQVYKMEQSFKGDLTRTAEPLRTAINDKIAASQGIEATQRLKQLNNLEKGYDKQEPQHSLFKNI